ncbi:hypothetical protein Z043_108600 [Scleropages formosus]|uniref:TRADD-like N-terminal domain-containing protein n=1 Tax=Scleropages formosus TaxID=113540 RepID=A0A0P7UDX7_SCLFO|nr:hypothetical protein Z043_108600 [Scleropages formosus]
MRVRAEYSEHESALRGGVSSDKQHPLERQFELFSRASSVLRSRDLGSIICDIKFSELGNLDAFWADYLSGALLEALKGVFITDSLKRAAGTEGVRLLVSVDQDDYEEGRRLLLESHERPGYWNGIREYSHFVVLTVGKPVTRCAEGSIPVEAVQFKPGAIVSQRSFDGCVSADGDGGPGVEHMRRFLSRVPGNLVSPAPPRRTQILCQVLTMATSGRHLCPFNKTGARQRNIGQNCMYLGGRIVTYSMNSVVTMTRPGE